MSDETAKRIAELEAEVADLKRTVKDLERLVRDLTSRLKRNSSNSSMPPSSDWMRGHMVRHPVGEARRRRGGQPGHAGVTRRAFPPEEVNRVLRFYPERCRSCRHALAGTGRMVEAH
jgi:transposase